MNKNKIFITIIVSGIAFGINYLINLVLGSFITTNVGTEAYGFVSLASTIASYALIASSALNSYAARYIAIEYYNDNLKKANVYYSSVFGGDVIIGCLLLIVGGGIIAFVSKIFNVPSQLVLDVRLLFLFVFINLFVNLVGTVFQSAAFIKDKLLVTSCFKGLSYLCEAVFLCTIYTQKIKHIYFVGISFIIASVVVFVSNIYITKKYTSELKIKISDFDITVVRELVGNGIWNSLNSLGNVLNSGLDLVVTNHLLGAVSMGQVSLVKTLVNVFGGLFQMVSQPFQPIFLKDYAGCYKKDLIKHLQFSMKVSGLISNIAFAIVVALGMTYYALWVPGQNIELLYKLTIIATATSIFEGPVYPLYYIYMLTVRNRIPCFVTIFGGLLNIIGMFVLIKQTNFGVYAVFFTTAIIMLSINGFFNPLYMCKCLGISKTTFYPVLIRHVLSCIVMTVIFKQVVTGFYINTWLIFGAICVMLCVIGIVVHFLIVFSREEKKIVIRRVIKNK